MSCVVSDQCWARPSSVGLDVQDVLAEPCPGVRPVAPPERLDNRAVLHLQRRLALGRHAPRLELAPLGLQPHPGQGAGHGDHRLVVGRNRDRIVERRIAGLEAGNVPGGVGTAQALVHQVQVRMAGTGHHERRKPGLEHQPALEHVGRARPFDPPKVGSSGHDRDAVRLEGAAADMADDEALRFEILERAAHGVAGQPIALAELAFRRQPVALLPAARRQLAPERSLQDIRVATLTRRCGQRYSDH